MFKIKTIAIFLSFFLSIPLFVKSQELETGTEKKIKVGATFSLNSLGSSDFKDIYGSSLASVGGDLGVMITDNIEVWATFAFASKSTKLADNANSKFKFKPMLSLNLRYHFYKSGPISLFGGGGFTGYQISDEVDSDNMKDVKKFISGFNLHVGCRYNVVAALYLQGVFRYNFVSKSHEDWNYKLDLKGSEVLFGVAYGF